jgi:hypothetical protein
MMCFVGLMFWDNGIFFIYFGLLIGYVLEFWVLVVVYGFMMIVMGCVMVIFVLGGEVKVEELEV